MYIVHYKWGVDSSNLPRTLATKNSKFAWGILEMYFSEFAWMEWIR